MATSSSFLTFFFLLITFTIKLNFATAGGPVKDSSGKVLNIESEYSITTPQLNGGGVTVAGDGIKNQLFVVLSPIRSLTVNFSDCQGRKDILTDENVTIEFANIPKYNGSSSPWFLVNDESGKVWYIAIGNAKDYPGHQIQTGIFKILPQGLYYKLVFCSEVVKSPCKEVGTYVDSAGNNRLVLVDSGNSHLVAKGKALSIVFVKKLI